MVVHLIVNYYSTIIFNLINYSPQEVGRNLTLPD